MIAPLPALPYEGGVLLLAAPYAGWLVTQDEARRIDAGLSPEDALFLERPAIPAADAGDGDIIPEHVIVDVLDLDLDLAIEGEVRKDRIMVLKGGAA